MRHLSVMPVAALPALVLALAPPLAAQASCGNGSTAAAPQSYAWLYRGNMVDLAPSVDMTVDCLELHALAAGPFDVEVWWCPVSAVGNETNPAAWTQLAVATGVQPAGPQAWTTVDVSGNGQVFQAGQTYGFYLFTRMTGGSGGALLVTAGGPTSYVGDHCTLTTRFGTDPFWANPLPGYEWEGILRTTAVTAPVLGPLGMCGQPGSGAEVTNATPGGLVAFAVAPATGSAAYAAGPCGNVVTGLGFPAYLAGTAVADASGTARLQPPGGIPPPVCGWHLQALDVASCGVSGVLTL